MGSSLKPFTQKVIRIIQGIPANKVMTYGQIAEIAGNKRGARQVARILHAMSRKYDLPWHRVVNARGEIAIQDDVLRELQIQYLQQEGVVVTSGKVELKRDRFEPQHNIWGRID